MAQHIVSLGQYVTTLQRLKCADHPDWDRDWGAFKEIEKKEQALAGTTAMLLFPSLTCLHVAAIIHGSGPIMDVCAHSLGLREVTLETNNDHGDPHDPDDIQQYTWDATWFHPHQRLERLVLKNFEEIPTVEALEVVLHQLPRSLCELRIDLKPIIVHNSKLRPLLTSIRQPATGWLPKLHTLCCFHSTHDDHALLCVEPCFVP
jgi:hypothetical protein